MAKNRRKGAPQARGGDMTAPLATWRVHLAADGGVRGVAVAAACAAVVAFAVLVSGSGLMSWILVAAFLWSLSDYFLPYNYTLTGSEVVVRTPLSERRMPWQKIHGY